MGFFCRLAEQELAGICYPLLPMAWSEVGSGNIARPRRAKHLCRWWLVALAQVSLVLRLQLP